MTARADELDKRPLRTRVWPLVPYAAAALGVYLVARRHPPGTIAAEIARGDSWHVLPLALLLVLGTLLMMAATDLLLLGHFFPEARYLDVLRGRAACVSLEVVNYGLGKGSYGLWLAKRYRAPPWFAGGLALYVVAGELCSMCIVGCSAIILGGAQVPGPVLATGATLAGGLLLAIVVGPLEPLGDRQLLRPWTRLPRARGLAHVALRVVQHSFAVWVTALAAQRFGLDIPLATLMAYIPAIAVVAALPFNVAGVGVAQTAWLVLEPWAPGERLVAFSLVWGASVAAGVVLRGLPFLRGVTREIGGRSHGARAP